jgi:hypothetical protein
VTVNTVRCVSGHIARCCISPHLPGVHIYTFINLAAGGDKKLTQRALLESRDRGDFADVRLSWSCLMRPAALGFVNDI